MHAHVSVVLTSCRRPHLLQKTLDSFFEFNDYPVARFLVIEDSDDPRVPQLINNRYGERVELMVNSPRIGQIRSIDRAYATVDTEYIFHCEDDWRFFRRGFVADSLSVLVESPNVHQVQLRDLWDNSGHPPERARHATSTGVSYRLVSTNFRANKHDVWYGFSFNPGLRRRAQYVEIGPYSSVGHEQAISAAYHHRGLKAAILDDSAVEHIGEGEHMADIHEVITGDVRTLSRRIAGALKLFIPPILSTLVKRSISKDNHIR